MDVREKTESEKRLIDGVELRRRIIAFATAMHSEVLPVDTVMMLLMQTPTVDAVEVVRCRQCKHCDPENQHCDHHMGTIAPLRREPDDFCSYGERKEESNCTYFIRGECTASFCEYRRKKQTNGDHIRAMSDEELAEMLWKTGRNYRAVCEDPVVDHDEQYEELVKWLQQPVEIEEA